MLIILDRDGVINEDSKEYIKSPEEWIPIPGSLEAIARLNREGHKVVIATNQSGIGRNYFSVSTLDNIHLKMRHALSLAGGRIDGIYYCHHHPDDHCECRKPKPGLLNQIAHDFSANLKETILIGDSISDIQAAQAVQCKAMLVLTGKGKETYQKNQSLLNDIKVVCDLASAVDLI